MQWIIVGCIFSVFAKKPPHVKEAEGITKSFVVQMEKRGLKVLGHGGCYTGAHIDALYADFYYEGEESVQNILKESIAILEALSRGVPVSISIRSRGTVFEASSLKN